MVHILDSLSRLELKFDDLASHRSASVLDAFAQTSNTPLVFQLPTNTSRTKNVPKGSYLPNTPPQYQGLTVPHKAFPVAKHKRPDRQ